MASREYDPEIKDIADYVANKPIDSELAVRFSLLFRLCVPFPAELPRLIFSLRSRPTTCYRGGPR